MYLFKIIRTTLKNYKIVVCKYVLQNHDYLNWSKEQEKKQAIK